MKMEKFSQPVQLPIDPISEETTEKRLWIGNLDQRLTEYQLLKILQPLGTIEKFDLLFHRSGPLEGQPRGYAFVTYEDRLCAVKAIEKLNGAKLGTKHVSVKWAHNITTSEKEKVNVIPDIPALAGAKKEGLSNKTATIQAIEAKLRLMQKSASSDPEFSESPSLVLQPPTVVPTRKEQHRPAYRDRYSDRKRTMPYMKRKRY